MFSTIDRRVAGSPAFSERVQSVRARGGDRKTALGFANVFALLMLALIFSAGIAQAGPQAPLDLNRATAEQLEALPGIGEVKAAAILAVRDARGGFQSMDELQAVRGIGPALAGKLKPLVTIGAKAKKGAKTAKK